MPPATAEPAGPLPRQQGPDSHPVRSDGRPPGDASKSLSSWRIRGAGPPRLIPPVFDKPWFVPETGCGLYLRRTPGVRI